MECTTLLSQRHEHSAHANVRACAINLALPKSTLHSLPSVINVQVNLGSSNARHISSPTTAPWLRIIPARAPRGLSSCVYIFQFDQAVHPKPTPIYHNSIQSHEESSRERRQPGSRVTIYAGAAASRKTFTASLHIVSHVPRPGKPHAKWRIVVSPSGTFSMQLLERTGFCGPFPVVSE